MDFTSIQEYASRENNKSYENLSPCEENQEKCNFSENKIVNILDLINDNQDLIEDCIENKGKTVLSANELKKYASLALSSAALECANEREYRSFAKKRVESMMNIAIAEASLIQGIQGKSCDNGTVNMEFTSIEETYC